MKIEKFYDKAYDWILNFGPKLIIAIIIIIIGQWLIRLLTKGSRRIMHSKEFDPSLTPFLASLVSTVLQILLVLLVMQILGIQMTIFAALIGAVGVAFGLALSGTLQNFTSGILILLLKPYRVGDNIIAQGQEGNVTSIQIFYTVVRTADNRTVIIPNSKLSNEVIINISREANRRLDVEIKFPFDADFNKIKNLIEQSIKSHPEILEDPAYIIGINRFESDGYWVAVNVWLQTQNYAPTKLVFMEKLIQDLNANGVAVGSNKIHYLLK